MLILCLMCGRYTVAITLREAAQELDATNTVADFAPRFNLAPTQDAPIAIERPDSERRVGLARFGLVPADSESPKSVGAKYINLRAEGVAGQRAFADLAAHRRALVLADGFYEWRHLEPDAEHPKGRKEPWYFRAKGGGLITFAGIWDIWQGDERIPSFAILTTRPSAAVAPIHDRMPLIVPSELRGRWLSPHEDDARALLRALRDAPPVELESWRVTTAVGSAANDGPELREPLKDADRS